MEFPLTRPPVIPKQLGEMPPISMKMYEQQGSQTSSRVSEFGGEKTLVIYYSMKCIHSLQLIALCVANGVDFEIRDVDGRWREDWLKGTPTMVVEGKLIYCGQKAFDFITKVYGRKSSSSDQESRTKRWGVGKNAPIQVATKDPNLNKRKKNDPQSLEPQEANIEALGATLGGNEKFLDSVENDIEKGMKYESQTLDQTFQALRAQRN
jgi:hypothetical protein